jgi:hypothetical protein
MVLRRYSCVHAVPSGVYGCIPMKRTYPWDSVPFREGVFDHGFDAKAN